MKIPEDLRTIDHDSYAQLARQLYPDISDEEIEEEWEIHHKWQLSQRN